MLNTWKSYQLLVICCRQSAQRSAFEIFNCNCGSVGRPSKIVSSGICAVRDKIWNFSASLADQFSVHPYHSKIYKAWTSKVIRLWHAWVATTGVALRCACHNWKIWRGNFVNGAFAFTARQQCCPQRRLQHSPFLRTRAEQRGHRKNQLICSDTKKVKTAIFTRLHLS